MPTSGSIDPATCRIVATIEARMTSSRLPGKVLMEVAPGLSVLELLVRRLQRAQTLDAVCIATTTNATDDDLEALADRLGVACFRGSEDDVLARVLGAARSTRADVIVETTGDCPLLDPGLVDACVSTFFATDAHYCANNRQEGLPRGLDVQVFTTDVLDEVNRKTDDAADHEHVSLYIYEHPEEYRLASIPAIGILHRPHFRWTVDTADDLEVIRALVAAVGPEGSAAAAARWLDDHPEVAARNSHVVQKPVR